MVVDPPYVQFDNVEPGFQTTVVATVSNKGLIDIRDVVLTGDSNQFAASQPLITFLPRLKAQQSVQVPYVVSYYGEQGALPGFAAGCGDNNPISSMGDFFVGLQNILLGSAPTQITGRQQAIMAGIGMGLAAAAQVDLAGFLGGVVAWISYCILGDFFGVAGNANFAVGPTVTTGYGPGGVGCFLAGTPIRMADGVQRPIEQVAVGDEVLTFEGTPGRVTQVYKQASDHVRELRYRIIEPPSSPYQSVSLSAGEMRRLETTDAHMFWAINKDSWILAKELEVGDRFIVTEGREAVLIETERFEGDTVVYNFDVEDYYSYFANDVLVRQKCGGEPEVGVEDQIRRLLNDVLPGLGTDLIRKSPLTLRPAEIGRASCRERG